MVWLLAAGWGGASLLYPWLRTQLVRGLGLGLAPSWGRAVVGAVLITLLFVLTARLPRPVLNAHSRGMSALGGVLSLLVAYSVFSVSFVAICLIERDGVGALATLRFWGALPYWPIVGIIFMPVAVWAPAVAAAIASALALRAVARPSQLQGLPA